MSDYHPKDANSDNYQRMSTAEKWKWHAKVYAIRRVILGVGRDEVTSPVDSDGKWFNEQLALDAERELRQTGKNRSRSYREGKQYDADEAGGRAVKEQWCRNHGYRDFREYMRSQGLDYDSDEHYALACLNIAQSIAKSAVMKNLKEFREQKGEINDRFEVAAALGARAREYTPAEMRAGRIALGIEPVDAVQKLEIER